MHGTEELIVPIIVLVIIVGIVVSRRASAMNTGGPVLILRRFEVAENPEEPILIDISGRGKGITAWFMTLIGLDVETVLTVQQDAVVFRSASLSGQFWQTAPMNKIASIHNGYYKPISNLIMAIVFFIGGIVGAVAIPSQGSLHPSTYVLVGCWLIAIILVINYALSKKMTIIIHTVGGLPMGLIFKRSVIENVAVDIQRVQKAIKLFSDRLLAVK